MPENITLYELNNMLSVAVNNAFPKQYKVAAEISELRENNSGHCYMELIEKDDMGNTVAKARANIWAATYRKLRPFFEYSTGISLTAGIKVLVTVKVGFDPIYHYSLTVWDIDPAYTVGDMAIRRTQILNRLSEEGVIDDNKSLTLSPVPQKIAVISSATAAGYGDFCDQLKNNSYQYKFYPVLFKALMQGERSADSVIEALNRVYENIDKFDCVVIIRGGGATSELNCFDDYNLALNITQFPLPVIVGIGHERDTTVLDFVAYKSVKTPTAVAEYLISTLAESDAYLNELSGEIVERIKNLLSENQLALSLIESKIPSL
ncbi:MAG: exodeoxyribonuclease VII large subunit, partial [Coprobacter sp.]|nr:exodeoxyribonuclease VII large subunit [Coprobacter sp.]